MIHPMPIKHPEKCLLTMIVQSQSYEPLTHQILLHVLSKLIIYNIH